MIDSRQAPLPLSLSLTETEDMLSWAPAASDLSRGNRALNCEVLSDWQLSRVVRVTFKNSSTLILKRSRRPLIHEANILRHVHRCGIPVPRMLAHRNDSDIATLVLEDLGVTKRDAGENEAADFAVLTHSCEPLHGLRVVDERAFRDWPARIAKGIRSLSHSGVWRRVDNMLQCLETLRQPLRILCRGANLAPYGLCHGEFHPSSLCIGSIKSGLVDWASAFIGPGLLDIASWSGTIEPPDPARCRSLIEMYLVAGGDREATVPRGGLPAEVWAVFWHRLWIVEWYVRSCTTWVNNPSDIVWSATVERHLNEAVTLLE